MATHPLENSWAKYNWARQHMDSVQQALVRSLDPNAHPVTLDLQVEERALSAITTVRIGQLPTIRREIGLALGDVLQNFRASLDHLAWTLVRLGTTPRLSEDAARRVYFPMARNTHSWRSNIEGWLPGVDDEYRKIVRRYQPYRRGIQAKAMRWLRNFSDRDKHRVLIPAVINQSQINLGVLSNWPFGGPPEMLIKGRRALYVGTPVLKATLLRPRPTKCEVQVQSQITIYPSLGYGVPIDHALAAIQATVLEILSIFDNLL
jgi:hypothetical protein